MDRKFLIIFIATLSIFLFTCDRLTKSEAEKDKTKITGNIFSKSNLNHIKNANINILNEVEETTSDSSGKFTIYFDTEESEEVRILISKSSYISDTIKTTIVPNQTNNIGDIHLREKRDPVLLKGTITDNQTDKPINEAKISLSNYPDKYTKSSTNGDFTIKIHLQTPTQLQINISKYQYTSKEINLDQVLPQDTINLKQIPISPPSTDKLSALLVQGNVVDTSSQEGIGGIRISLQSADSLFFPRKTTTTKSAGTFQFEEFKINRDRELKLSLSGQGYKDKSKIISLTPENNKSLSINLEKIEEYQDLVGIEGSVEDQFGNNLKNVQVSIQEYPSMNTVTNASGEFSFNDSLSVTKTKLLHFVLNKDSYFKTVETKRVSPDLNSINLSNMVIDKRLPVGIEYEGHSPKTVRVKEAGGEESTGLSFEVEDKLGEPYDISGITNVSFDFEGTTLGATLSADSTETDENGIANVELRSGRRAGVVKIIASLHYKYKGEIIDQQTKPINLTIHGGYPVIENFNVGPEQKNIPGLKFLGETDKITAYAGDKWSNAVKEGTAIWFSTEWSKKPDSETESIEPIGLEPELGFIMKTDETGLTNNFGEATATLKSSPPSPSEIDGISPPGEALYTIYAHTRDSSGKEIVDSTTVLFTGSTQISFLPPDTYINPNTGSYYFTPLGDTVSINYNGVFYTDTSHVSLNDSTYKVVPSNGIEYPTSQTITFFVTDQYNNPLTPGTQLNTKVGDEGALSVSTDFPGDGLADTKVPGEDPLTPSEGKYRSPSDRYHTFHITIGTPHIDELNEQRFTGGTSVKINVTGPNGNASTQIPVQVGKRYESWIPSTLGTYNK